jgi:putative tricarboxylic transport membrane protein
MGLKKAVRLAIVVLALSSTAKAQQVAGWRPQGNVEFVVGAGAGGENDRVARAVQRVLTKEHVIDSMTVVNKPGAGQVIAMNYLVGKNGDANEIGLVSGSFINSIARNGSDLNRQMTPLIKLFDAYQCYFANANSQYKSMADVRNRLQTDPTSITFAVPVGLGNPLHLSVVNLAKAVGAPPDRLVVVVFNSGFEVATQAAGNHIDVGVAAIGSVMPLIKAGTLRMLGISAAERQAGELAIYPTLLEQGLDVVTANPYAVVVPNGLTPEQIAFWLKALEKVIEDPDFKLDLQRNFWTLNTLRYPATVKWMQDDYDENRAILTQLGLLQ